MQEIAMHLLDVAQNSIAANADLVEVKVSIDKVKDTLTFMVKDNGKGMDEATVQAVKSPFYTSRTTRKVGLGIPMLINTAELTGGFVELSSKKGEGTEIKAVFGLSNIDRPPMGDLSGTMLTLIYANENTDIKFSYDAGEDNQFSLDTREVRKALDGVPLSEPSVMSFIKDYLFEGIKSVNNGGVL